jgi:hypothetical protein
MKCLNWNIIYDDHADHYLFNTVQSKQENKTAKTISENYLYLNVNMDCISLFVTENTMPVAFLLLDKMKLNMKNSPFTS